MTLAHQTLAMGTGLATVLLVKLNAPAPTVLLIHGAINVLYRRWANTHIAPVCACLQAGLILAPCYQTAL